jgi:hypothetical protein
MQRLGRARHASEARHALEDLELAQRQMPGAALLKHKDGFMES